MKRGAICLFLGAALIWGGYLLFGLVNRKADSENIFSRISSETAIIDISGEQWEQWVEEGAWENFSNRGQKVILRVNSDKPIHWNRALPPSGNLLVIAPNGLVIGDGTSPDSYEPHGSVASVSSFDRALPKSFSPHYEVKKHGNAYALAIREGGAIRTAPERKRSNRAFEFENDQAIEDFESLKIED